MFPLFRFFRQKSSLHIWSICTFGLHTLGSIEVKSMTFAFLWSLILVIILLIRPLPLDTARSSREQILGGKPFYVCT